MRIVLDTNILARAASGPPSPAGELLKLCLQAPHVLCVSPFLISELSRVLRYDRVRRIHGMPDQAIDQFLLDLQIASLTVDIQDETATGVVAHDPDDDPIVATAMAAKSDVLCTLDRHLRTASVVAFCDQQGIEIISDVELLARLRRPAE